MLICDTHCDTLYALAEHPQRPTDVTLPRLQTAGVSLQTLALYVGPSNRPERVTDLFVRMEEAFARLLAQGWRQADDPRDAKAGETRVMLSIEGCEILQGDLARVEAWRQKGVRMAALTWNYENDFGTPAKLNDTDGLKPYGREAVREMVRLGIAVDTSHLNERGFWDLLEMGVIPLASHSCCQSLCRHKRNLSDDQLKALFAAGGYVGINFYPWFLSDDGQCTLDTVADHALHMLELGGEGHIGLGSDFYGIEAKVPGLENPLDVPALLQTFERRGITGETLEGIAGRNLLRYYDRIDPR